MDLIGPPELGPMWICPSCSTRNTPDAAFCIGCGNPAPTSQRTPSAPGALAPGVLVDGKYAVIRVLGEGGMGIVYVARDVHTDVNVVLKAIRSEFAHNEDFRQRILAEGRVLARIDHPNVVRLNAVVVEKGALYLVMQFIEGESLDALIARHVSTAIPIAFPEAIRIFRQILEGVAAAHREGIIHRDLKPANILLRARDGAAKVTDFGIAKAEADARAGRGKTQGIIGSLWYMAPEQLRGQRDVDKRVDIYALGILLFELLAGRVPFDAPSDYEVMRLHTEAPLPSLRALRPDLPFWIDELLARACAKDRDARFSTCEEMLAALSAYELGRVSTVPGAPPWIAPHEGGAARQSRTEPGYPSAPPESRSPLRVLAIAAGALVVLGGGAAALALAGVIDFRGLGGAPSLSNGSGSSVQPGASGGASPASTASGAASSVARAGAAPLAALVGRWKSDTNRDYDAVVSGNVLEFRIVDASQYPRQGYRNGDARFTLTAVRGQDRVFGVEDHIRPVPPAGVEYDETRARPSCQEVWSTFGGQNLRAEYDGSRLTVDLVKIETRSDRFQTERDKVVACRNLKETATSKIESVLVRVGG